MSRTIFLAGLTALMAVAVQSAPAQAQLARTWVSNVNGNDANDCNRLTPCRTFQRAHDNTLALGEISVLDPGAYGGVTITKGISIINDGVGEAGMLVSGGVAGATINAGANDHVSLRGITIKGIGFGGGNGIVVGSVGSLSVENSVIRNMTNAQSQLLGHGIIFNPNGASPAKARLVVSNTLISDNDGHGMSIIPNGSMLVTGEINRTEVYSNGGHGIVAHVGANFSGNIFVAIANSVAGGNNFVGFASSTDGGPGFSSLGITNSVAANNTIAGVSTGNEFHTEVNIGYSMIYFNGAAWPGANVTSFGNNIVVRNGGGNPAAAFTLHLL